MLFYPKLILINASRNLINEALNNAQETTETKPLYDALNKALNEGWRFYVVEQERGRCYNMQRVITVPIWAVQKGLDYRTWYLSHELSHFLAFSKGYRGHHGKPFMEELKNICPKNCIHFETTYKAKFAASAGISKSMHFNTGTVPSDF